MDHTCALVTSGGVKCWGNNYYGQLGNGTYNNWPAPVDVSGLNGGVTAISAGEQHTCALNGDGSIKCWGYNYWGQLGDGTIDDRITPVDVSGLNGGATAVAADGFHTCALAGGAVKCWGKNDVGQIGDGTTTTRLAPVDIVELNSGVTEIAAGQAHTCALTDNGGVRCWGDNDYGQIGDGSTAYRYTPTDVIGFGEPAKAAEASPLTRRFWASSPISSTYPPPPTGRGEFYPGPELQLPQQPADHNVYLPLVVTPLSWVQAKAITTGRSHTCRAGRRRRQVLGGQ